MSRPVKKRCDCCGKLWAKARLQRLGPRLWIGTCCTERALRLGARYLKAMVVRR